MMLAKRLRIRAGAERCVVDVDTQQIAGYTVLRPLGSGGMGQVFLVQHPRLPRQDAMKLLDSGVSRNDEFKVRFQREADLLAQLSHPNIVTLFDRGEFNGQLWITMEYIDGTDAAALSKTAGALPIPLALTLIGGAAAALDYAWRKQRITHRDVKPANILIALDGDDIESVKLADFGIAKAAGETTTLTSTGITVGTVSYISPEAIEGRDLDNRADIYSLGCTAYQLITGTVPFPGNSIAAQMSAHLTRPVPDVAEHAPHLPPELNVVFATALAKQPEDRYQSCGDFVADLRAAAAGRDPGQLPAVAAATAPTISAQAHVRPHDPQPPSQDAKPTAPQPHSLLHRRPIQAAAVIAVVTTAAGITVGVRNNSTGTTPAAGTSTTTSAALAAPVSPPPVASAASSTTAPAPAAAPAPAPAPAPTTEAARAGFYGEWGQHSTSITLAPDGTAHYATWLGAANGVSWSATWSTMSATTAMIVLSKQVESHGDTDTQWLHRYPGEAFTFTLRPDGYATITTPSGEPLTLCPRGAGFRDTQGLCGA